MTSGVKRNNVLNCFAKKQKKEDSLELYCFENNFHVQFLRDRFESLGVNEVLARDSC